MRCFTCLGTSENLTRHLPAAASACKSQSVFKLLPGGCSCRTKGRFGSSAWGRGLEGHHLLNQSLTRNTHHHRLLPGHYPQGPKAQSLHTRPVTTSDPFFQCYLWVSLIVFKGGFSRVFIPFALSPHTCTHMCSYLLQIQAQDPLHLAGQRQAIVLAGARVSLLDATSVHPSCS